MSTEPVTVCGVTGGVAEIAAAMIPLGKAAKMLGMHVDALHRWRLAGRLECVRFGAKWHTTEPALLAVLQSSGRDASKPNAGAASPLPAGSPPSFAAKLSRARATQIAQAIREAERLGV